MIRTGIISDVKIYANIENIFTASKMTGKVMTISTSTESEDIPNMLKRCLYQGHSPSVLMLHSKLSFLIIH